MSYMIETQTKYKKPETKIIYKTSSFEEIIIKPNSLVLCDIDDTVLRYGVTLKDCLDLARKHLVESNDYIDEEDTKAMGLDYWDEYRSDNKPYHTDLEGFKKLEQQLINTNSTLLFVTARSKNHSDTTEKQLVDIGIETKYPIHYTADHKISKADYISKFIQTDSCDHMYFIDDLEICVKLVKNKFPNATCIIFEYK